MPVLLDAGLPAPARGVFSTRQGGASRQPWHELNLAVEVGDAFATVQRNRALVAEQLGVPGLAFAKQVHGTAVRVVSGLSKKTSRGLDDTDGLVTTASQVPLAIKGADCLPVLLTSVTGVPVVGAAHVGRRGLVAGLVEVVIEAMRDQGGEEIRAVIGPGICGRCYEVPASLAGEAEKSAPGSRCATRVGTTGIDLTAGAGVQLERAGVTWSAVGGCTYEQPDRFYSYRRDGVTGRHAGVVWLP